MVTSAVRRSELLDLHFQSLYVVNDSGRMLRETVEQGRQPPRFHLMRGPGALGWHVRHDVPDAIADELGRLAAGEAPLDVGSPEPAHAAEYKVLLEPIERTGGGPVYAFPDDLCTPGGVDQLPVDDRVAPAFAVVVDDKPVSTCTSARLTSDAAQAGLETVEAFRGRGYAGLVTAAWGIAVRARGLVPLYSTWWDNTSSQRVAAKLSLELVGADYSIF